MAERSFFDRLSGAARFDIDTYEEVEADEALTGQAALVVFLAAVASALGAMGGGTMVAVAAGLSALGGWLVWAGVTYLIGDKLLGGTATWGELLRATGFAHAPMILMVVGVIPLVGGLIGFVLQPILGIWVLMTGFVAVRQALDVGNLKTFVTIVLGGIATGVLYALF